MRIGLACFDSNPGTSGGVDVYARGLLGALASNTGGEHELVALIGPEDPTPAVEPPVSVVRIGSAAVRSPFRRTLELGPLAGRAVAAQIDRLALDVIHYPATRLRHPAVRTPVVLTFFDAQEEVLPGFFSWRERMARRLWNRRSLMAARFVIVPSWFTADHIRASYGVSERKIVRVPVGISSAFQPTPEEGEKIRLSSRYRLPAEPFTFYPANPWPHKNHERLLAALAALRRGGCRVPLVCTGRLSGERRSVSALARAQDDIFDLGFVAPEDVPALYRAARLLIFPSFFEGFGIPVLEAMASGCPVACSRIPPLLELAGDAAQTFDPGSEKDIGDALKRLWSDAAARRELAVRGLQRAVAHRWPVVVPHLVDVYKRARG